MLNSPDDAGSAAPAAGSQAPQPGAGGEQLGPAPAMTISVTAQEKEAIDRVCNIK